MREELKERCDLLVSNREILRKQFSWDSSYMILASAGLFANMGVTADGEKLKEYEKLLKEKTEALSVYRGNTKTPMLCKMAVSDNPMGYFESVQRVYDLINKKKFFDNEYKLLSAMTICDCGDEERAEEYIARTEELYARMKKEHPWLTSDADIPFATMLAITGQDVDHLIAEMEEIYTILKKDFSSGDSVQSLSHVLAMDSRPAQEKCERVKTIFDKLKEKKHKFGVYYELMTLGILAMLDIPTDEIVELVIEADDYLKDKKGFGDLALGAKLRRMYGAQLVGNLYKPEEKSNSDTLLAGMLAYTIAAEAMMIAVMCSCIVTTTSSTT